jgi:hypothetical protein
VKLKRGVVPKWGLRCRDGVRTSAGGGRKMFGTRYYYIGLRAAGGKWPRAALLTSNVTRSYASKGFLRHVW